MYVVRLWATRRAGALEAVYTVFLRIFQALDPLWRRIGHGRLEKPVAALEAWFKGALFDCRMCGHCILVATGMTCPMNCPKSLRNGPCGGVRPDGTCEVEPDMRCVWVEAWAGSRRMGDGEAIMKFQGPVDHRHQGSSSWLRLSREKMLAATAANGGEGRE